MKKILKSLSYPSNRGRGTVDALEIFKETLSVRICWQVESAKLIQEGK